MGADKSWYLNLVALNEATSIRCNWEVMWQASVRAEYISILVACESHGVGVMGVLGRAGLGLLSTKDLDKRQGPLSLLY